MQALHGRRGHGNHGEVSLGAGYTQGTDLTGILRNEIHGLDGI